MGAAEAEEGQGMRHYQCRICGATRSKRTLIVQHMQQFHPAALLDFCVVGKDRRRYQCTICGDSRSKLSLLRKHISLIHSPPSQTSDSAQPTSNCRKRKRYECKVCGRQAKKASHLEQHLLTHSSLRPFVCSMDGCGKCYKRQDHLNRHLLQHEGEAHLCPRLGCIMLCSNRYSLLRHLQNHDLKDYLQRGGLETKVQVLQCPERDCSLTFKYPCRLQSHYDTAHGLQYADIICGEPGCGERFSNGKFLLQHIRRLHPTISCQMCGVSVSRKCFKRHLMGHESSQVRQRLFCPFDGCVHSFASSFNLSVHIKIRHMGRREYCCTFDDCNRTFGYRHTRDNHEKTHLHCHFQGDFEEEDLKFQARPRGGRKRATLQTLEGLFRKRVVGPKEEGDMFKQDG